MKTIKVYLSPAEVARLDALRGRESRSGYLARMLAEKKVEKEEKEVRDAP